MALTPISNQSTEILSGPGQTPGHFFFRQHRKTATMPERIEGHSSGGRTHEKEPWSILKAQVAVAHSDWTRRSIRNARLLATNISADKGWIREALAKAAVS